MIVTEPGGSQSPLTEEQRAKRKRSTSDPTTQKRIRSQPIPSQFLKYSTVPRSSSQMRSGKPLLTAKPPAKAAIRPPRPHTAAGKAAEQTNFPPKSSTQATRSSSTSRQSQPSQSLIMSTPTSFTSTHVPFGLGSGFRDLSTTTAKGYKPGTGPMFPYNSSFSNFGINSLDWPENSFDSGTQIRSCLAGNFSIPSDTASPIKTLTSRSSLRTKASQASSIATGIRDTSNISKTPSSRSPISGTRSLRQDRRPSLVQRLNLPDSLHSTLGFQWEWCPGTSAPFIPRPLSVTKPEDNSVTEIYTFLLHKRITHPKNAD
ncbi:MAG: hypothetical protein LQ343_006531 [Gyalolechia ehrenbergii]|nr:MAG: hypothetical protein LQ343_006531 [Gyalolechia ehrenbergii]